MSNNFYFASPNDSDGEISDNDTALPFPKPIDRSAFLDPDFDAASFLASLTNRFQTLEDLQTELRELVQSLNKSLVDLVNDNYQEFLSLGSTLSGGEVRIEEVQVGLLGFQRDVTSLRDRIDSRRAEVADLLQQKKDLRREIERGRVLLEIAERIDDLEYKLQIAKPVQAQPPTTAKATSEPNDTWDDGWSEDTPDQSDDDLDDGNGVSSSQKIMVERYQILKLLASKYDPDHPFLISQQHRLTKIRESIQLDLENAIRQEENVEGKQNLIKLRSMLDN